MYYTILKYVAYHNVFTSNKSAQKLADIRNRQQASCVYITKIQLLDLACLQVIG